MTENNMSATKKFRFHVLSLPHTITIPEYSACAYTMKVLKFCKMMRARGHYIIHYGHQDSIVDADECVALTNNDDLRIAYGDLDWRKDFFQHNIQDHCHVKFNDLGSIEILKRIQPQDFVLPFWGKGAWKIVDTVNKDGRGTVVEPGIGYHDSWCNFRIYESYCILHHTMGTQKSTQPSWYHAVIPNYFNIDDFDYSEKRGDYYLFLGRIAPCKGAHIAMQICEKIGAKLIMAGQGDIIKNLGYTKIPDYVEYVGYAGPAKRKELMKHAKGFFLISNYAEPFGGAAVEAMMSGCPVIVPDYGVFPEIVLHGITGYRCRTFDQFCWAAKNVDKIKPQACRDWAVSNYSLEKVSGMYEEFFTQVNDLYRKGWYEMHPERTELNWLHREYPVATSAKDVSVPENPFATATLNPFATLSKPEPAFISKKIIHTIPTSPDTNSKKIIHTIPTSPISTTLKQSQDRQSVSASKQSQDRPKVAIWSENQWAFGRIHATLIKYLKDDYDFTFIDWKSLEENKKLFTDGGWKNYDVILSNSSILYTPVKLGYLKEIPVELKRKCISVYHCPVFNQEINTETFIKDDNYVYAGVSKETVESLEKEGISNVFYTPTGVDLDVFRDIHRFDVIKTIGFVGIQNIKNPIKRPHMAQEIADKANKKIVFINQRPYTDNEKLYAGIDLLICTSTFEGGPLGLLEAAACGIPVISTPVGVTKELKSIKTFTTVEEAVEIIKYFEYIDEKTNEAVGRIGLLKDYAWKVSKEVREKKDFEELCEEYWKPVIEYVINKNKTLEEKVTPIVEKTSNVIEEQIPIVEKTSNIIEEKVIPIVEKTTPQLASLTSLTLPSEIDILIPIYETKLEFLKECLESISNQTYTGLMNIILVDDGNSPEYFESLKNLIVSIAPKFRIGCKFKLAKCGSNLGISKALNLGLRNCTSEFIFRMDADDIMLPERILLQLKTFVTLDSNVAVLGTNLKSNNFLTDHPTDVTKELLLNTRGFWLVNHPTVCFRSSIIKQLGGYPEVQKNYPEDIFCWYHVLENGYSIKNISDITLEYRDHANNSSKKLISLNKDELIKHYNSLF